MRIFRPVTQFFKSLTETQRFSIIGVILGIPIIVLTLIFVLILNEDLRTLETRYDGTHYNYLMKELLKDTEKYRYQTMLNDRSGTKNLEGLEKLLQKINEHFTLIDDYKNQSTNIMHTSNDIEQLKDQWEDVAQSVNSTNFLHKYKRFQADLIEKFEIITIDYNLNLAEDKYVYNLTNTVVKIMPRLIEQIIEVQLIFENSLSGLQVDDERQIIYSTSIIQSLLNEFIRGRKIMLETDTSYQKYISYHDPQIVDEVTDFISFVQLNLNPESKNMEQIIQRSLKTTQISFDFYDRELDHLDTILSEQLRKTKIYRLLIMSFQLIAFILTVYGFIGFYLSNSQSIKKIDKEKEIAKYKYQTTKQKLNYFEQKLSRQTLQAHEQERKKIARDLHDSVGQALYSISIHLNLAQSMDHHSDNKYILKALKTVEVLMEDIRRISHTLRPRDLDKSGFIPTLKSYIKHFQKIYAIKVSFEYCDEDIRLNSDIETQLYRICQEALTNVAKHAQATTVHVSLDSTDAQVTLTIKDNGCGFDVNQYFNELNHHKIGLYSMKERAELLGGKFNIISELNVGTTIVVKIPMN